MEMKAFSITDQKTGSTARISCYGATVISYKQRGREILFLSTKAKLDGTKAIRGGIPPVFPVFGKATDGPCKELPQHGFARTSMWRVIKQDLETATLELTPNDLSEEARQQWSYDFKLQYTVSVSTDGLHCSLAVENAGSMPFEYQTLLHTYFRVEDIAATRVIGLKGHSFKDKVTSKTAQATDEELVCESETDRVYIDVQPDVQIDAGSIDIKLQRANLNDVVVWNPWIGCKNMGDFGPEDGYKNMICVEAGAVSGWQSLAPGASKQHSQTISVV